MIAFKYTKTDGAEYLSHLDLLRHIDRTLRRAGVEVKVSEGFNPHPKINMNNPLGLGIKSVAEFCTVESDFAGNFKDLFNANSPKGVKCVDYKEVTENPNYAYTIDSCTYTADSAEFSAEKVLSRESIIITDKRGRTVDIRERIHSLEYSVGKLTFTLGCGTNNLRPDLFLDFLYGEYALKAANIIKIASHGRFTF